MIITSKQEMNLRLAVCTFMIFFILSSNDAVGATATPSTDNPEGSVDIFGIKEIYLTKPDGKEWFLNMDNPRSDGIFFIISNKNITRQSDGSWLIDRPEVRMNVDTPPGAAQWKNVEITGYAKVLSVIDPSNETDLAWYARSGRHSNETPCEVRLYRCI